jgi:glycosyltransferase involved in cell wall biosynthesis
MPKLRIVLYTRWPTGITGGVERFVAALRDAMIARGHVCDVVCAVDLGCAPDTTVKQAAQVMALHWAQHRNVYDIALFNGEYGCKAFAGRTVDVFHGTYRGQIVADWPLRRWRSIVAGLIVAGATQGVAARRHCPVAVSRATGRELLWLYGVPGARVIQNAVDVDRFSAGDRQAARKELGLPANPRIYLYASRVEPRKCPWFVAEWANALNAEEHLVVATDKPIDVAGQVTSLQNVPSERMPLLYQAADAFLMPSYFEGCSYAVIEAMSSECLLVASPVGHAADIMQADRLLAECFERRRKAPAFLERARRLLAAPLLAARLRAHARRYVLENNTLDKMGARYEALFEEILQKSKRE